MNAIELAAALKAEAPELAARISKAVELVPTVERSARVPNLYYVKGAQGHHFVVLDTKSGASTCSCPDFVHRQVRCKHRIAVDLAVYVDAAA